MHWNHIRSPNAAPVNSPSRRATRNSLGPATLRSPIVALKGAPGTVSHATSRCRSFVEFPVNPHFPTPQSRPAGNRCLYHRLIPRAPSPRCGGRWCKGRIRGRLQCQLAGADRLNVGSLGLWATILLIDAIGIRGSIVGRRRSTRTLLLSSVAKGGFFPILPRYANLGFWWTFYEVF